MNKLVYLVLCFLFLLVLFLTLSFFFFFFFFLRSIYIYDISSLRVNYPSPKMLRPKLIVGMF